MHREGAWVSSWARGRFSMDAMTMTDGHSAVNGRSEDELARCGAASLRKAVLRVWRIGVLMVEAGAEHAPVH